MIENKNNTIQAISRLLITAALIAVWPVGAQTSPNGNAPTDPNKELDQVIEHSASAPARNFDEAVDRAVNSERILIRRLRDREPVIETYIQEMKSDSDLGYVPKNDFYFVGELNMKDGVVDRSFLPGRKLANIPHLFTSMFTTEYYPRGFADEMFLDVWTLIALITVSTICAGSF